MSRMLVVMALKAESRGLLEEAGAEVLYTGVGKVNASYQLTRHLTAMRRSGANPLVVNFGTAGSQRHPPGSVLGCDRFVQRDMDLTGLGFDRGHTPFEEVPAELQFAPYFKELAQGRCSTADRFETLPYAEHIDVVDMEAYALAKVCHLEGVQFACAKYVSDNADDDAGQTWEEALVSAARAFVGLYRQVKQRA